VYDAYERRSGLIRILPPDSTAATWGAGGRGDLGDLVAGLFRLERLEADGALLAREGVVTVAGATVPVRAESALRLGGGRLDPTLEQRITLTNLGVAPLDVRVGVEYAITMLGGGGNPEAWWESGADRVAHDATAAVPGVAGLAQGNDWLGVRIASTISPAADAWVAPIETVSNSESGFERVYQGSALLLSWPITLAPGERFEASVRHDARIAVDRAVPTDPSERSFAVQRRQTTG
jgi:alpha-amylase